MSEKKIESCQFQALRQKNYSGLAGSCSLATLHYKRLDTLVFVFCARKFRTVSLLLFIRSKLTGHEKIGEKLKYKKKINKLRIIISYEMIVKDTRIIILMATL